MTQTLVLVEQGQASIAVVDELLANPRVRVVRVGPAFDTAADLYAYLATCLAAPRLQSTDPTLLRRSVIARVEILADAHRPVVALLEQASFCSAEIIQALLELAKVSSIHLVAIGEWDPYSNLESGAMGHGLAVRKLSADQGAHEHTEEGAGGDTDLVRDAIAHSVSTLSHEVSAPARPTLTTEPPKTSDEAPTWADSLRARPALAYGGLAVVALIALVIFAISSGAPDAALPTQVEQAVETPASDASDLPAPAAPEPERPQSTAPPNKGTDGVNGLAATVMGIDAGAAAGAATNVEPQPDAEPSAISEAVPPARDTAELPRAADSSDYTLQLAAFSSPANRDRFLSKAEGDTNVRALAETQQSGQALYVITYGVYDSYEEARRASEELPDALAMGSPVIRRLGDSFADQINASLYEFADAS